MKKVKILHISSAISWRGGEQQIVNLIEGLETVNKEVDQKVYFAKNSALESYLNENSIPFSSGEKNSGLSFSYIKSLYQLIKSYHLFYVLCLCFVLVCCYAVTYLHLTCLLQTA